MTATAALRREVEAVRLAVGGVRRPSWPRSRQLAAADDSGAVQRVAAPPQSEPEETFGDLARNAGRLLRARLRRAGRLGRPRGRGHLRAALVHCAGWLVVVLLVTMALAWTVWQAAVSYRVSVQGPASESVRILEVSLEDLRETAELERQVERGAAPLADGRAPGSGSGGGGGGGGLKIEGPLLGAVGAGAVLAMGGLAGLVVLRRYRARLEQELPESDDDRRLWPEPEVDDEALGADLLAGDLPSEDESPPATKPTTGPGTWSERTEALKAASERLLQPRVAIETTPVFAASERVYERRRAPRIPVELEGELHWKGGHWPLLVNELSRTGLRFLVEGQPVAPGTQQALAPTDCVRITFTALDQVVTVNGKVPWRRTEEGATLAGLQFMTLAPEAEDVIAQLCPEFDEG